MTEKKPKTLDERLETARDMSQEFGNLRGLKETADDYVKTVYAHIYADDECQGSVAERDAYVRRHPEYLKAIEEKKNRYANFASWELRLKILFAEVEKYRTDRSYEKHIDKAHT